MTWTLSDSGTTSALTIGSETILATDTNNGTFVFETDTTNMANGDLLEARVYTITLSGSALAQAWKGSYQNVQTNIHKISPPIATDQSIKCTLKQSGGTINISTSLTTGTIANGVYFIGSSSSAQGIVRILGGTSVTSAAQVATITVIMSTVGGAQSLSSGEQVNVASATNSTAVSSANGTFTMNGLPTGRTFAWKMLRI
jgi:hypothetical protein